VRRILTAALVTIRGLCLPAMAGEGYVGASYMNTNFDIETEVESGSLDSDGWKIFGGYNLMKYFGVEVTWYDLGSFEQAIGEDSYKAEIQVFDVCARGIIPLGERFELFARVGYSNVSVDLTVTDAVPVPTTTSVDATDWELLYGIGAGVKLGKRFGIRAEWESWDVETSLDAWSLGAYFRF